MVTLTVTPPREGNADAARNVPVSVAATAVGDTAVLAAPGVGFQRVIFGVYLSNNDSAKVIARLQESGAAIDFVTASLAADGGGVVLSFGSFGWTLAENVGLDVNLPAGGPFDVFVNVLDHITEPV